MGSLLDIKGTFGSIFFKPINTTARARTVLGEVMPWLKAGVLEWLSSYLTGRGQRVSDEIQSLFDQNSLSGALKTICCLISRRQNTNVKNILIFICFYFSLWESSNGLVLILLEEGSVFRVHLENYLQRTTSLFLFMRSTFISMNGKGLYQCIHVCPRNAVRPAQLETCKYRGINEKRDESKLNQRKAKRVRDSSSLLPYLVPLLLVPCIYLEVVRMSRKRRADSFLQSILALEPIVLDGRLKSF